ncbi:uncharacterized protein MONOS_2955 [Monocercomonoides exilis]|uniref:uncharacterized protein n=1 Tax=Monocercomonoides exilis TaxID=2049356 RepID=UPI00355A411B|nr:hypothetical protein MONOS_2955 [Monocercomonoides exilis]|eukprot:MONOS_2955.1-p1 / transcript=MONOS_2955.1 / gene=MONOS_2955 / organism=Monocercomonoides_exilis_PA203 / gene_product=unspecified product / transcript_product=unspecified product / location=Mono_scaffold00065:2262-5333(-) / protein_length=1024 / sequence_SO=supercontig / SO=protein_coding / is_pseudo=false
MKQQTKKDFVEQSDFLLNGRRFYGYAPTREHWMSELVENMIVMPFKEDLNSKNENGETTDQITENRDFVEENEKRKSGSQVPHNSSMRDQRSERHESYGINERGLNEGMDEIPSGLCYQEENKLDAKADDAPERLSDYDAVKPHSISIPKLRIEQGSQPVSRQEHYSEDEDEDEEDYSEESEEADTSSEENEMNTQQKQRKAESSNDQTQESTSLSSSMIHRSLKLAHPKVPTLFTSHLNDPQNPSFGSLNDRRRLSDEADGSKGEKENRQKTYSSSSSSSSSSSLYPSIWSVQKSSSDKLSSPFNTTSADSTTPEFMSGSLNSSFFPSLHSSPNKYPFANSSPLSSSSSHSRSNSLSSPNSSSPPYASSQRAFPSLYPTPSSSMALTLRAIESLSSPHSPPPQTGFASANLSDSDSPGNMRSSQYASSSSSSSSLSSSPNGMFRSSLSSSLSSPYRSTAKPPFSSASEAFPPSVVSMIEVKQTESTKFPSMKSNRNSSLAKLDEQKSDENGQKTSKASYSPLGTSSKSLFSSSATSSASFGSLKADKHSPVPDSSQESEDTYLSAMGKQRTMKEAFRALAEVISQPSQGNAKPSLSSSSSSSPLKSSSSSTSQAFVSQSGSTSALPTFGSIKSRSLAVQKTEPQEPVVRSIFDDTEELGNPSAAQPKAMLRTRFVIDRLTQKNELAKGHHRSLSESIISKQGNSSQTRGNDLSSSFASSLNSSSSYSSSSSSSSIFSGSSSNNSAFSSSIFPSSSSIFDTSHNSPMSKTMHVLSQLQNDEAHFNSSIHRHQYSRSRSSYSPSSTSASASASASASSYSSSSSILQQSSLRSSSEMASFSNSGISSPPSATPPTPLKRYTSNESATSSFASSPSSSSLSFSQDTPCDTSADASSSSPSSSSLSSSSSESLISPSEPSASSNEGMLGEVGAGSVAVRECEQEEEPSFLEKEAIQSRKAESEEGSEVGTFGFSNEESDVGKDCSAANGNVMEQHNSSIYDEKEDKEFKYDQDQDQISEGIEENSQ